MENPTTDFANTTQLAGSMVFSQLPEDCRLARAAGVNMLIVLPEGIGGFAKLLMAELPTPVVAWRPGEPVPSSSSAFRITRSCIRLSILIE